MDAPCNTCDAALVLAAVAPPQWIDVVATTDALASHVHSGRMRYLRGDVPLEQMVSLAESDRKYTIVSFLQCTECERTRFWGLCIRGAPIYRVVEADAPERWLWEPVPPASEWMPA